MRTYVGDGNSRLVHIWQQLCRFADPKAEVYPWDAIAPVLAAYSEPHRHYHNARHLAECWEEVHTRIRPVCDSHPAVDAAILFHDCVYDPTRRDNEERSADVAEELLRGIGWQQTFIADVREMILATTHSGTPRTRDAAAVVDADLSILGKPPAEFDEYELAIRLEYTHVCDVDFAAGRAKVLRNFLDRPTIYHTPPFRAAYEGRARENLTRSLARLARPDSSP